MIWLWRIFFSIAFVLPLAAARVNGTVELTGSTVPAVRKHTNYSGVVVWLEPLNGTQPPAATVQREMVQKGKAFRPHVLAIPVGSSIRFPNVDPIFHNAFSNYSGQVFDVGLYPPGKSRTVTFRREGIVRVFCNIHSTMSAIIVVLKTPYFAVSAEDGSFTMPDVPPGRYQLHAFYERATENTLNQLTRAVVVDHDNIVLPPMSITESGYVQTPHQNKYGKAYPPVPDDLSTYPGSKK
jgi:Plastocyanin